MLGSRNAQDALAFRLGQPVCRPPCVRFVFADHVLGLLVCRQRAIPTGTLGVPPLLFRFVQHILLYRTRGFPWSDRF